MPTLLHLLLFPLSLAAYVATGALICTVPIVLGAWILRRFEVCIGFVRSYR